MLVPSVFDFFRKPPPKEERMQAWQAMMLGAFGTAGVYLMWRYVLSTKNDEGEEGVPKNLEEGAAPPSSHRSRRASTGPEEVPEPAPAPPPDGAAAPT